MDRARLQRRTIITYGLYASGLPKDVHYVLWVLNVGGEPKGVADAFINAEGRVVNVLANADRHIAEDPINLKVFGGKGEPIKLALISDEGLQAFAQIVPFPIDVTSGPCRLSAIETAPYNLAMFIKVSGFQPGEELLVDTRSENEGGQDKGKTDDSGVYNSGLFPLVKGKLSGRAQFNITSKTCKIGIEFPWGEGSYQYQ